MSFGLDIYTDICTCIMHMPGTYRRKKAVDPLEQKRRVAVCYELNWGPLQKQPMCLATDLAL